MNNYEKHAWEEFRAAGWTNDKNEFNDGMQEAICTHVLKLLSVFADEGHSGSSAPYAINLFEKLAKFEPVAPLTGEDWEWVEVSDDMYQNKRCSHVFKGADGKAYDIDGKIFWDWHQDENGEMYKSHFTGRESRVYIEFPYVPKREYVFSPTEQWPDEVIIK